MYVAHSNEELMIFKRLIFEKHYAILIKIE